MTHRVSTRKRREGYVYPVLTRFLRGYHGISSLAQRVQVPTTPLYPPPPHTHTHTLKTRSLPLMFKNSFLSPCHVNSMHWTPKQDYLFHLLSAVMFVYFIIVIQLSFFFHCTFICSNKAYFSHGSFSFVLPGWLYWINRANYQLSEKLGAALIVTGESGADILIFP